MNEAQTLLAVALGICSLAAVGVGLVRHLVKFYLSELRQVLREVLIWRPLAPLLQNLSK